MFISQIIKLSGLFAAQKLKEQIKNIVQVPSEQMEDYIMQMDDSWAPFKRSVDKLFDQIDKLSRNDQMIKQHKSEINRLFGEINKYLDPELIQLFNNNFNILLKTHTHDARQWFDVIYSWRQELNHYIDGMEYRKHNLETVQFKHHYGSNQFYIRFGKYPKSERSRIGLDSEWIQELHGRRFEDGVSVYKANPYRGKWVLREPNKDKSVYNSKFDIGFVAERIAAGEIYLVTGQELKHSGVDGEPLITDVFPIKRLSADEILLDERVDAPTLGEWISKYYNKHHLLGGFSISDKDKREIALLLPLFIEILESDEEMKKMNFSETDEEQLIELYNKCKGGRALDELSNIEINQLKSYIVKYKAYRNKRQVFKGFRPFY